MNNIFNLRIRKNVSLHKLSKIVGVSKSTISRYENETCQPSHDVLRKLADYFKTTPAHLMLHTSSYHSGRTMISSSVLMTLLPEICTIDINDDDNRHLFHGTPHELPDELKHRLCLFIKADEHNHMTITVTSR